MTVVQNNRATELSVFRNFANAHTYQTSSEGEWWSEIRCGSVDQRKHEWIHSDIMPWCRHSLALICVVCHVKIAYLNNNEWWMTVLCSNIWHRIMCWGQIYTDMTSSYERISDLLCDRFLLRMNGIMFDRHMLCSALRSAQNLIALTYFRRHNL